MFHSVFHPWLIGKKQQLEPQTESFGAPAASKLLVREHRKGFELPKVG